MPDDQSSDQPVDHYNDPQAPPATSLVPTVRAAVQDDDGRLLLAPGAAGAWGLPGGPMRVGESVADAALRAVAAQSGVRVEITGLVGIYTSPYHVIAHPGGEVHQELVICFAGRPAADLADQGGGDQGGGDQGGGDGSVGGSPDPAGAHWVAVAELDGLAIHPATRTQLNDALADRARPRIQ